MQPFLKHTDLVLSYCQSIEVDEDGNELRLSDWADALDHFKWKEDYTEVTSVELKKYLSFRNTIVNASAVVFKKPSDISILEESTKMKMLGDWLFWRKLLAQEGEVAFFSTPHNFFRIHPHTTRAATTKEKEIIRMKEYYRLIVPEYLSIFNNGYDWMIEEWHRNRAVLKNTRYYYMPDVPPILFVRFLKYAASKIKKKYFGLHDCLLISIKSAKIIAPRPFKAYLNNMDSNTNNKIHIALALDKTYRIHVYALLTSIFYNNRSSIFFFHVIATGINEVEKEDLRTFIRENNADILFYDIDEDYYRKKFYIHSHYSIATYYRLFFAALIDPEIKRLLYTDCDIIVIGDLKELYNIEMGDAPLAAASDPITLVRHELGIHSTEDYFNAGVMVMNMSNWRSQHVTENAIKYLADNPEITKLLLEQDALNATLIGKWFRIDRKYNFTWLFEYLQLPKKDLLKDVVIVHYITPNKPWHALTRNKFRYLYQYYLKRSPKANEKKYVDFKWTLKDIWVFIRIRLKEFYFDKGINKILPVKKWMQYSQEY